MIDVLFVIPNSSKKIYQNLANDFSAIEPPTWALLLASSMIKNNFSCEILDCDALRLNEEDAIIRIKESKCRLACFVLYGQQPNQGTFLMIGATSLAENLKKNYPDIKIGFVGSHISALPMEVLSYAYIDFVFINEGVYALRDLLKTNLKDNLSKVCGIGYKDENNNLILNPTSKLVDEKDMNIDLPGYAWHLLPKKNKTLDQIIKSTEEYKNFVTKNSKAGEITYNIRYTLGGDGLAYKIDWEVDGKPKSYSKGGIKFDQLQRFTSSFYKFYSGRDVFNI